MAADTSRSPISYKSGIQTWSLVVVILLLIPGAYAFLYFADRDNYLTNRYFRALSELDLQVNQSLVGLDKLLEFALHPKISPDLCAEDPSRARNVCDDYEIYLRQFSDKFSQVKFGNKGACDEVNIAAMPIVGDKTYFEINGVPDNRKVLTYECSEVGSKNSTGMEKRFVSVSVALRKLIDPTPALQYFDQVLLLDSEGDVVYRSGKDDLTQTTNISARDDYARFENLGHYLRNQVLREVDLSSGLENFTVDRKTSVREVSHSTIREATIGKIDYLLFIQPFHPVREQVLPKRTGKDQKGNPGNGMAGSLSYIVGVVPYDQYFLSIVSLPLWKITNLFLLFLFLLALVPHLKLFFSGSYFMPNRVFAWWLGASFPLLILFICNAWLAWEQYDELENSMDSEAEQISQQLKVNFRREINAVMALWTSGSDVEVQSRAVEAKQNCKGYIDSRDTVYPLYGVAFFIEGQGQITGCLENNRTVNMRTEASVSNRRYFSTPGFHPELLFSWIPQQSQGQKGHHDEQAIPYYTERIQSYDHGLKLTALSFPLKANTICSVGPSEKTSESKPCVFSVVKLMQSFFAPILPLGFGFAVIDDHSGEVYYHSNDQRSLIENFYIETDREARLIAAVQSRHSQYFSGSYHAHRHRFYSAPLDGTPWSLVVFYKTSSIELANLRTVLLSLIYSSSITILLLLIPLVTGLIFPGNTYRPTRWLLPNGTLTNRIRACFLSSRIGRMSDQGFSLIYVGSAVAMMFLIFGVIAWASFFLASEDQIERLQRFNLLHAGRAISARMNLVDREQQRLGIEPGKKGEVTYIDDRKLLEFAIYYPENCSVYEVAVSKNPKCALYLPKEFTVDAQGYLDSPAKGLGSDRRDTDRWIDRFLPVFNAFDASYLQMRYLTATDHSWYFSTQEPEHSSLYIKHHDSDQYARIYSSHPVPHTHSGLQHGMYRERQIYLFFALFLGIFVLYRLGRLTAKRLMGLHLPDPQRWAEQMMVYRQEAPVEIIPADASFSSVQVRENLATIVKGNTPELKQLKAILYSRACNRIINTYNVKPIMWLILSGILKNENGLEFRDPAMKEWIRQQPWQQETREFYAAQSSDMWRVVAPAFYALLLLGFILITMSGGKIGDFLMGIVPVVLAGGIPAVTQMIRERLK